MNIGKSKSKPKYICDKCGKVIPYTYQKGYEVNKYYKQDKYDYSIKKDFDLCNSCKRKLQEWLKEKDISIYDSAIDRFPIFSESEDK